MTSIAARLIATVALVAALVAAAPANGVDDNKAKSTITIERIGGAGASGKVSSQREGCKAGRKVTLFIYEDFVSIKVKITASNSKGKWRVKKDLAPGKYFAKVDSAKIDGTRCLYDVSRNQRI